MKDLIERLERTTGPDHSLDIAIARRLGVTIMRRNDDDSDNIEDTHWRYTEKTASDCDGLLDP